MKTNRAKLALVVAVESFLLGWVFALNILCTLVGYPFLKGKFTKEEFKSTLQASTWAITKSATFGSAHLYLQLEAKIDTKGFFAMDISFSLSLAYFVLVVFYQPESPEWLPRAGLGVRPGRSCIYYMAGKMSLDAVVRWSSAKGIGRVTSRLTYTLSDEVLSSLLDLFSPGEVCYCCWLRSIVQLHHYLTCINFDFTCYKPPSQNC